MALESWQGISDAGGEEVGDREAFPADGQHLRLEAAGLADRAGHEHV